MNRSTPAKRGRPLKFGRAADVVTLTLPKDVVTWLETIDADLGWAVVKLHQRDLKAGRRPTALASLVQLPGGRALILVRPEHFSRLKGVSLIPLADGRAFLALDSAKGVADLQLAVIDRLENAGVLPPERDALVQLRNVLKRWHQEGIRFESRSIIVAHRPKRAQRVRTLAPIRSTQQRG